MVRFSRGGLEDTATLGEYTQSQYAGSVFQLGEQGNVFGMDETDATMLAERGCNGSPWGIRASCWLQEFGRLHFDVPCSTGQAQSVGGQFIDHAYSLSKLIKVTPLIQLTHSAIGKPLSFFLPKGNA